MRGPYDTPCCYVLDDAFRLVLACNMNGGQAGALPLEIESAVRAVASGWSLEGQPNNAHLRIDGLRVTVTPLRGPRGRNIAVYVMEAAS